MKDRIIEFLNEVDKARDLIEINDFLNLSTPEELQKLENELEDLEKEGIIHVTKKGKYILMKYCPSLKVGKIDVTKGGFAFLILESPANGNDEKDIFIAKDNLNGAIDGDLVLLDSFTRNGKIEGKVLKILNRKIKMILGEVLYRKNELTIILKNNKDGIKLSKINNSFKNLVDGHIVAIELSKQIKDKEFEGTIIKVIGHKNDPDIDILSVAGIHGIELEFSDAVKEELKTVPDEVTDKDKVGRTDLTLENIFTIDGDDTKDIDDAISIKKAETYYELGVHIADVSYYVLPNTALYESAYYRGTSTYLADTVIPMIPHELSNGICSLNPSVERLTISCVMKIDYNGKLIDYDIFPSVIKSKKQMTYKNVNKILMENIVPEGYEEFANDLLTMKELADILRKRMIKNGYIEFNIPEPKIIQDENGKCIDIIKREQLEGEKLIEDFMIMANETVATHIYNMSLPFIYRVHGLPKTEKISDFINLLKMLNINVSTKNIDSSSKSMQRILNELKGLKEEEILSTVLLRTMQKAIYDTNNIGHFGLALKCYTHFTSPIRRFPDTTVHRLLRTYLFNKDLSTETINYFENYLVEVAAHSSEREQASVEAEREVDAMKMAEYMENHIGEEYNGIISTVTSFGFFVELPNLVEGLVHINSLKGYYTFVPEYLSLINKSNNMKYKIGDEVRVKVINASKETKTIDFEVVNGNN